MTNSEAYRTRAKAAAGEAVLDVQRRSGSSSRQSLLSSTRQAIGPLADDRILCKVAGHDHPEWEHQFDWALQDLKKGRRINNYHRGVWSMRLRPQPGGG